MSIRRSVVDAGEKFAAFCANDIQNIYYHYLFLKKAKRKIGSQKYVRDCDYEIDSKNWWKRQTGLSINTLWHSFYSDRNGIIDLRYIPENIYYSKIEPYLNRKEFTKCCDDKCFYSERFPAEALSGASRPRTLLRNVNGMYFSEDFSILTVDEAASVLHECITGYVIKESITGTGGNRLIFVNSGEKKAIEGINTIFARYGKDFVVEELITQCPELEYLNPSSVNTIRLITYMNENGVHILSAVMRMGGNGARMDNFSAGGIACGILPDGTLKSVAYDQQYNQYTEHPNGVKFAGRKVPNYDGASELVKRLHQRFGHFRIISWDVAIGSDYRPILIEFNLTPQSIDFHQINNGPLFGDLTEEVLGEVFKKR